MQEERIIIMDNKIYFIDMEFPKLFGGVGKFVATSKARNDVTDILKSYGHVVRVPIVRNNSGKILGPLEFIVKLFFALRRIPKGSVLFQQYPYFNLKLFVKVASWFKKYKTITLVHDLASYRYSDKGTIEQEIYTLNQFDTVIVHSENMKDVLIRDGLKCRVLVLGAFDYLLKGPQKIEKEKNAIVFAGGLAKSKFLGELRKLNRQFINFNLYGKGLPEDIPNEWLRYKGVFNSDDITSIQGEWGLLWEGDSIETCSGNFGDYLKIIAPHKLSLYLACGLKVIVWENSAMAALIKENKVGITIKNIGEIEDKIKQLSDNDLKEMEGNIAHLSKKVREGGFLRSVLQEAGLSNSENKI